MPDQTNKNSRLDFASKVARMSKGGFDWIGDAGVTAAAYADLFAAELTDEDFAGTSLDKMTVADIQTAMAGLAQINDLLNGNDGLYRKAFRRLAQFAK